MHSQEQLEKTDDLLHLSITLHLQITVNQLRLN